MSEQELVLKSFLEFLRTYDNPSSASGALEYNIFRVINKAMLLEDETNCALLIDWLHPRGHHRHGNLFLKKFLPLLGVEPEFVDDRDWQVEDHPSLDCGYPDIVIRNDKTGHFFLIELKVQSEDHVGQLQGYYNYLISVQGSQWGRKKLVYLTCDGRNSKYFSAPEPWKGNFLKLSLNGDISHWLESVLPEIKDDTVKRGVTNYLNVLPNIIGEAQSINYEIEILSLLSRPWFFPLAKFVYQNYARIAGTIPTIPTAQLIGWKSKPATEETTLFESLGNDGVVFYETDSDAIPHLISFFIAIREHTVRIGLTCNAAVPTEIEKVRELEDLKYQLWQSGFNVPDGPIAKDLAWKNMGDDSMMLDQMDSWTKGFLNFFSEFNRLVSEANKKISQILGHGSSTDAKQGDYDCSVCRVRVGHNLVKGIRYCNECCPKEES